MINCYFIADLHLDESEPTITAAFLHFLFELPDDSKLYILGDLFDSWIGDDIITPLHHTVADALRNLKQRHILVYFIHGNRDFLISVSFAKQAGFEILPDIFPFTLANGKKLLLLHGDLLCTDDKAYQHFRCKMHNKWLQRLFLALPRFIRQKIASKLRSKSQHHNQYKAEYIMDVNQQKVEELMDHYQADIMIHGHTHKPAQHVFMLEHKQVDRVVLGAWHDGVSYIHLDKNWQVTLIKP